MIWTTVPASSWRECLLSHALGWSIWIDIFRRMRCDREERLTTCVILCGTSVVSYEWCLHEVLLSWWRRALIMKTSCSYHDDVVRSVDNLSVSPIPHCDLLWESVPRHIRSEGALYVQKWITDYCDVISFLNITWSKCDLEHELWSRISKVQNHDHRELDFSRSVFTFCQSKTFSQKKLKMIY